MLQKQKKELISLEINKVELEINKVELEIKVRKVPNPEFEGASVSNMVKALQMLAKRGASGDRGKREKQEIVQDLIEEINCKCTLILSH